MTDERSKQLDLDAKLKEESFQRDLERHRQQVDAQRELERLEDEGLVPRGFYDKRNPDSVAEGIKMGEYAKAWLGMVGEFIRAQPTPDRKETHKAESAAIGALALTLFPMLGNTK